MKTSLSRFIIAFAFGIGFFSWQSCKERTTTRPDLIPSVDNIHTFQLSPDSLDVTMSIGVFDSVRTNQYRAQTSPLVALGQVSDPFFGSFWAGLYTQFVPPVVDFSFPDPSNTTFDSAILALPYAGFTYGDTLNAAGNFLSYKVYRVTEPLNFNDSSDYTFTDHGYDPVAIGGGTYSFKDLTDSFVLAGNDLSGQLRIKLDKNYVYTNIVQTDTAHLSSNKSFTDYFNGWYIVPEGNASVQHGRVSYFGLAGDNAYSSARVDFYFHDSDNKLKVISFPYRPETGAFVNRIKKDYQGTPVGNYIQAGGNQTSAMLQGLPGIYTLMTIRNLNKIPPSVINQAQLVLTAKPVGEDAYFPAPQHLVIEKVTPSGILPIEDVFDGSGTPSTGGLNFMDGNPQEVTIGGQKYMQYKLNFPRELQRALLAGEDSITFRITASSIYQAAFRMVAPGLDAQEDTKMKLNIIYTKLN